MRRLLRLQLAALLVVLGLVVGCGGDDNGDGGDSVQAGKTRLIDSCHEGNEGDEEDLELCRCTADRLEKKHGYDTAAQFDKATKAVEGGEVPPEVQESVDSCTK
jgi:hypothetical protein